MRKRVYFDKFDGPYWPAPHEIERYFLAPPAERWTFEDGRGNDSWGLSIEGLEETDHLEVGRGRIDINLTMLGDPSHGVLLHYWKTGRAFESHYSRGDLSRLHEWVTTLHGDRMPIGLYIPYEVAWGAVKEFMQNDGALPSSIAWIASADIPSDAFPEP